MARIQNGTARRDESPKALGRVPRYRSIAAELSSRITSGQYPAGSLLPSEAEIAQEFGVTRMTVRHALSGLATQGTIERRHGHGTLVAPRRVLRQAQHPLGLAAELSARGVRPGSHILKVEEVLPPEDARSSLRLGPRAAAVRILRLRRANELLIGLQETFVPARYCPGLLELDLEDLSLTQILRERYGLTATHADLTIEAVEATPKVAMLLDVRTASALVRSTRVSYLADDRPLERTMGWFPGTRYVYQVRQGSNSALVSGSFVQTSDDDRF
jgi:GntR family transcriptional regulator